ncbi:MAG: sugar transferase [Syntrophobacteraceae bacterium]
MYTPELSEVNPVSNHNTLQACYLRSGFNGLCKRCFDIFCAVLGLIVAAPTMGVISFLLKVESPGDVIFSQTRIGLHGKRFRMHKFRKFPADWGTRGPAVTVACDARMTFIGRILEKLKFDELPQLWNIMKGEMSFVGPRPESLRFADMFEGKYGALLNHVPGIFGPSQIAFRNESGLYPPDESPESFYRRVLFPQKAEADLAYFERANCLTDIFWITKGLWVSVCGAVNWRRLLELHARVVAVDVSAVLFAWVTAHLLRFSGWSDLGNSLSFFDGAYIMPGFAILMLYAGGCYRRPVRYFSLADSMRLVLFATIGWLLGFLLTLAMHRGSSVYLMPTGWFILLPSLMFPRVIVRLRWQKQQSAGVSARKKFAIYGAGRVGNSLAGWMFNGGLVGFIDDDSALRGRLVSGYEVLGRESDIPTVHDVHAFCELWVTFLPDSYKRKRLTEVCKQRDIKLVIIPELEPFASMGSFSGQHE